MNTDTEQYQKQGPKHLAPYQFKPGQSGNPGGRPKGPTLKVWAQQQIMNMEDEDRIEFLKRIPPEIIWRMAEGNPTEDRNIKISVPKPILGGLSQTDTLPEGSNLPVEAPSEVKMIEGTTTPSEEAHTGVQGLVDAVLEDTNGAGGVDTPPVAQTPESGNS